MFGVSKERNAWKVARLITFPTAPRHNPVHPTSQDPATSPRGVLSRWSRRPGHC